MDNNENQSLCDLVQMNIALGEELDTQSNAHLDCCKNCRAFKEQNDRLAKELSSLCVSGIQDGDISSRVMKEIQTAKPFYTPKFKLSRHLGTAAAVLIVVALFASSRGYNIFDIMPDSTVKDNTASSDTTDTDPYSESDINIKYRISPLYTPESATDDAPSFPIAEGLEAAEPESDGNIAFRNAVYDDSQAYYDSTNADAGEQTTPNLKIGVIQPPVNEFSKDKSTEPTDAELTYDSSSAPKQANEESAALNGTVETENTSDNSTDSMVYASGGGGGSSAKPTLSTSSTTATNEQDYTGFYEDAIETESCIFQSVAFDTSENNLSANVELANNAVIKLFPEAYLLSAEVLFQSGITNKMFIEWTATVTSPSQYSLESILEYCFN